MLICQEVNDIIEYSLPQEWKAKIEENKLFIAPKNLEGYLSIRIYDYLGKTGFWTKNYKFEIWPQLQRGFFKSKTDKMDKILKNFEKILVPPQSKVLFNCENQLINLLQTTDC